MCVWAYEYGVKDDFMSSNYASGMDGGTIVRLIIKNTSTRLTSINLHTHRQRHTHGHTHGQTHRDTDTHTLTQTDRHTDRQTHTFTEDNQSNAHQSNNFWQSNTNMFYNNEATLKVCFKMSASGFQNGCSLIHTQQQTHTHAHQDEHK